ncbi:hypothetical protein M9H77_30214 [Catharanthus roseus]|uniref:Uncharacterized protein n=1 Tax=Catharanthus roseus TaxID=4058 RepID=A0ACB9ZZ81_CATRO|nr:hypothetical protein M9H77_30214 [Catharanthus roseus]
MKAKEEGMGKELSIGFEDTSLSLSLNLFLYYHEFSFKDLKFFFGLYASYVTLVGNMMEFMWLLFCGKKMNGSFKVVKVHPCYLAKTTFENGAFELTLRDLDEKLLNSLLYCKEKLGGLSPLKETEHQIEWVTRVTLRF